MTDHDPIAPPEALNGFLLVHAALRKGGNDLLAATARFGETPKDPAMLNRLWGFYSRGLRVHHHGEDGVVFPRVTSRQPDFADVQADMRAEHQTVDELLAATDAAFANLRADKAAARANEAHAILGQLTEALDAHLAHEEAAALPVVLAVIPEPEMVKIEKGLLKDIQRKDLGLTLAALEATTKEHPELHMPPVPKPALLLLSLLWRRRYAGLVAQANA